MDRIVKRRLVPVAVIDQAADSVPLAEALLAAGIDILEITLRTAAAENCITRVREAFPTMLVGAGTVLSIAQLERAIDAGAQFGVSPGLYQPLVSKSADLKFPFIPGVLSPSEVERGLALGCKLQKFFPAEAAGGLKMLQALSGPYAHTGVKFIPLGGITAANARDYLALPIVAAVGGSWMVDRKLISERNWSSIRRLTTEAAQIAGSISP